MGDIFIRKPGSYTIETSFVMMVVIVTLMIIIIQAYSIHDKTKSAMVLHRNVEVCCHQEEDTEEAAEDGMKRQLQTLFYLKDAGSSLQVEKRKTEGSIYSEKWKKSIISYRFEPEAFLRMTVLGQEWGIADGD